jgi:radical SAM superfamily enzyme YgiQ (UPF0313 family)
MKILFVVPPQLSALDPSLPVVLQEEEDPMPPLGLLYVGTYLKKYSKTGPHDLQILDCQLKKMDHEKLREILTAEKPDILGMTVMTFSLLTVKKAAEIIKQVNRATKVVLGGPHVYIYPKETLAMKEIDFVVLGEGEKPFTELVDAIDKKDNYRHVKGLGFKNDDEIIINECNEPVSDLDSLPFPDRSLIDYKKYGSALAEKFPVTTMITSRGCPFQCVFCNRPHLGKVFRCRSAKNVVEEIKECAEKGINDVFIYDDTFTVNRQRVVDICQGLLDKKIKISWDVRARVDTVDLQLLNLMKKAGCNRIHFGVEAGTQKVINNLKKGITIEKAKAAFNAAAQVGMKTLAYFMMGSPGETKEDILETIRVAKMLNPDFAHFSITTPYPATELYSLGLKTGIVSRDFWKEFAQNPTSDFTAPVWEENLKKEELYTLLVRAYSAFYWRPKYMIRILLNIKSFSDLIRKASAGLKLLKM